MPPAPEPKSSMSVGEPAGTSAPATPRGLCASQALPSEVAGTVAAGAAVCATPGASPQSLPAKSGLSAAPAPVVSSPTAMVGAGDQGLSILAATSTGRLVRLGSSSSPVSESPADGPVSTDDKTRPPLTGRAVPPLILVADDEPLAAIAIKRGLEQQGFRILGPAGKGSEAIRLAETGRPDLAVLDIEMPEVDGLAAADRIQNQLAIPVIILSAFTQQEYLAKASRIGVSGYLVKPVKPEELGISIELSLTRFRQIQTLAERVAALEQNLNDRKIIERAKGILMKAKGITEEDAYLRIQKTSRRTHRKMIDVAKSVLEAEDLL